MRLKILAITLLSFGFCLMVFQPADALPLFNNVCDHSGDQSSVCKDAEAGANNNPLYGPEGIITIAVNLISVVVGIAAVLGFIMAGIKYITSGSNPEEANQARELIIYAVVGLILATAAQLLIRVVLNKVTL